MTSFVGGVLGGALIVGALVAFLWWRKYEAARQRALVDAAARENADYFDAGAASAAPTAPVAVTGVHQILPAPPPVFSPAVAERVAEMGIV